MTPINLHKAFETASEVLIARERSPEYRESPEDQWYWVKVTAHWPQPDGGIEIQFVDTHRMFLWHLAPQQPLLNEHGVAVVNTVAGTPETQVALAFKVTVPLTPTMLD